ncbi:MAG: amidohydrolase family protein [Oligoflexales bacterium]
MKPYIMLVVLIISGCVGSERNPHEINTRKRASEAVVFQNGFLVDPKSEEIFLGYFITENGLVKEVGKGVPAGNGIPQNAQIVDLNSKYVIPGLFDLHTHAWGNPSPSGEPMYLGIEGAAKLMLFSGVTGFLDLFSEEQSILQLRDKQREHGLLAADIFAAGPCFTATDGHCTEYGVPTRTINTPEEAEREVRSLAKSKPDVIKIVYDHHGRRPTINLETLQAAIETGTELGIRAVVHIGTWQDAKEAVEAGAKVITHLDNEELPDDLVALLKKKDVVVIPTLVVQRSLHDILSGDLSLEDPLLVSVTTPKFLSTYGNINTDDPDIKYFLEYNEKNITANPEAFAKLHKADVTLLPGTDVGNITTFLGYSLHREVELFVQYGMTTWEALRSATLEPAKFLKLKYGFEPGAVANFVVLESSPVENISATRKIEEVIYHGAKVDRSALKP